MFKAIKQYKTTLAHTNAAIISSQSFMKSIKKYAVIAGAFLVANMMLTIYLAIVVL